MSWEVKKITCTIGQKWSLFSNPLWPRVWFQAVFPTSHSAGWVVWCPWRWVGCARGSHLFPNIVFLFSWRRMKIWPMTLNMLLLPWGVQLSTAPSFTLSLFIYFYLIVPFGSCLGSSGGKNIRSDGVWCSSGTADQGPPQPVSSLRGCDLHSHHPRCLHSQKPSPGTSEAVTEPAEQLQLVTMHGKETQPAWDFEFRLGLKHWVQSPWT